MHTIRRISYLGILLSLFASHVHAEGDPAIGEELARENCVRCHNIEPKGAFKQHPPSFAAIAVYRSEDQIYGRIVFPPLHAGMPQIGYMLTPNNIKHLVAYIQSLEAE